MSFHQLEPLQQIVVVVAIAIVASALFVGGYIIGTQDQQRKATQAPFVYNDTVYYCKPRSTP